MNETWIRMAVLVVVVAFLGLFRHRRTPEKKS
jgi:hypothetical protein